MLVRLHHGILFIYQRQTDSANIPVNIGYINKSATYLLKPLETSRRLDFLSMCLSNNM